MVNPNILEQQWDTEKNKPLVFGELSNGSGRKVWWLCDEGHSYEAQYRKRSIEGQGCPYCAGRKVLAGFNDLATYFPHIVNSWHPDNSISPQEVTPKTSQKVKLLCSKGHEWVSRVATITKSSKVTCPICSNREVLTGYNDLITTHPEVAKLWHPNKNPFDASKVTYGSSKRVWWQCDKGHEWEAVVANRQKYGCPTCSNSKVLVGYNDLDTTHPEVASQWGPRNEKSPTEVTAGSGHVVTLICDKQHSYSIRVGDATRGIGCSTCAHRESKAEIELREYVVSLLPGVEVRANDRRLISPQEVDIYVPSLNMAVELNGLFWHSEEQGKGKYYHNQKYLLCKAAGVQLVQIWEDDWRNRKEVVQKMIAHKLGISTGKKVYARQTVLQKVDKKTARRFLDTYHIQGYATGSVQVGLMHEDTLVALASFRLEADGTELNLVRYATSRFVVGGFSKLVRAVLKDSPKVELIYTFSDNTISDGALYETTGFVLDKELAPDYSYLVKGERKHKFLYRRKAFRDNPSLVYQEGLSERQLAKVNKLWRIWDAGKLRWVLHRS